MIAGRAKITDISNTLIIKPFIVIMSVQYKTGKSFIKNYLPSLTLRLDYRIKHELSLFLRHFALLYRMYTCKLLMSEMNHY